MKRSTLLSLAICTAVLSVACDGKSDSKSGSSKSPRKHSSAAGSHAAADSGSEAADASAADGGDGAIADAEASADAEVTDAGSADAAELDSGAPAHAPVVDVPEMSAVRGDPGAVDRGPYYDSGSWKGYLWISQHGQGSMIVPTDSFAEPKFASGNNVCIKGSVVPTPDSSGNAMLGMNVNQDNRSDAETLTMIPTRAGVQVDVTNPGGSPLRVQVHALDGATNGDSRWCATLTGSGGFVPWSQFNTACWDGSGKPYDREPISVAMLLVPGNTESAVPYDFCLSRLAEADAPAAN